MTYRGYIDQNTKHVFFWSPKCACTKLFDTLKHTYGDQRGYYNKNSSPWRECIEYAKNENFRTVALVRHPATRIVSAYANKFVVYRDKRLHHRSDLERFSKNLFDDYCFLYGKHHEHIDMSFRMFLETIKTIKASGEDTGRRRINVHWQQQVPTPLIASGFQYDRVVKFEHFSSQFRALCTDLGLSFDSQHLNATQWKQHSQSERDLSDIPAAALDENEISVSSFLNKETLDLIYNIYRDDFLYLGYDIESYAG